VPERRCTPAPAASRRGWARTAAGAHARPRVTPAIRQNRAPTGRPTQASSQRRSCSVAKDPCRSRQIIREESMLSFENADRVALMLLGADRGEPADAHVEDPEGLRLPASLNEPSWANLKPLKVGFFDGIPQDPSDKRQLSLRGHMRRRGWRPNSRRSRGAAICYTARQRRVTLHHERRGPHARPSRQASECHGPWGREVQRHRARPSGCRRSGCPLGACGGGFRRTPSAAGRQSRGRAPGRRSNLAAPALLSPAGGAARARGQTCAASWRSER